ncbi:bacteriocin-like protein [Chryseobacterium oryctis]|uniref:Bacteriocin-type signal sequence-containing protein n=1 Tax=Chryseobacterium oryctis TaxID=2952618 RepID=A0ABT3HQ62_9FLAO|nr:hypothetical protein [Chryseobacterium oryctis]MCW3161925.1 hypothetical protein [Chryseobacterium oryctis]
MKNLKKISRNQLKAVKGSGCGDYFPNPTDPDPTSCDCNLWYCEKMGACIHSSFWTNERCVIGEL